MCLLMSFDVTDNRCSRDCYSGKHRQFLLDVLILVLGYHASSWNYCSLQKARIYVIPYFDGFMNTALTLFS